MGSRKQVICTSRAYRKKISSYVPPSGDTMAETNPSDGSKSAGNVVDNDTLPQVESPSIINTVTPSIISHQDIRSQSIASESKKIYKSELSQCTQTSSHQAKPRIKAMATESPNSHPPKASPSPEIPGIGWLAASTANKSTKISFEDYLALSEITFEWSESYDDKDWMRLRAILAPTLMIDYTEVNGHKWDTMPASDFVSIMSNVGFVGDPLVHTQHHIGASKWQKISEDEVIGHHQLRAAHQRYTNADLKTVENKGHGHAMIKHYYRKVRAEGERKGGEGEWKLAGLRPTVRWNEFEFEKIFRGI